jgi:spore germination cell wall hydrolase CwlJ-like protein
MKKNLKSILSLGIMFTFVALPIIAVTIECKERIRDTRPKGVAESKNFGTKEDEPPTKKQENIEKLVKVPTEKPKAKPKVEVTKEVKKETLKPTSKPSNTNKSKQEQTKTRKDKTFYLSSYERKVVECVVMGESGGESYKGQTLVAFCILNACKKDGLQPSEVRRIYKYSGWNNKPNQSVKKAVRQVFDDGYKPVNDTPLYFYAPKHCNSAWHETQRYICTVGGHKFFGRW